MMADTDVFMLVLVLTLGVHLFAFFVKPISCANITFILPSIVSLETFCANSSICSTEPARPSGFLSETCCAGKFCVYVLVICIVLCSLVNLHSSYPRKLCVYILVMCAVFYSATTFTLPS